MDKPDAPDPSADLEARRASTDYSQPSLFDAKKALTDGEVRKAQFMLERLVQQTPTAEALLLLAQIELDSMRKHAEALEHLRQAVAIDPQNTPAWLTLANYWSLRSQPDKQRRCLEKILVYEPNNRDVKEALKYLTPAKR